MLGDAHRNLQESGKCHLYRKRPEKPGVRGKYFPSADAGESKDCSTLDLRRSQGATKLLFLSAGGVQARRRETARPRRIPLPIAGVRAIMEGNVVAHAPEP